MAVHAGHAQGWGRLLMALTSGACLALAFPPTSIWPLAFVGAGLLPLTVRGLRARAAFGWAFVAGMAFFLPTLSWVDFPGVPVLIALAVAEALFLGLAGVAFMVVQRLPYGIAWCPFVWVLDEALRGRYPFGGFPWSRLAFSQVDEPALHWASVGGAPLVSFVTAAGGCGLVAGIWAALRAFEGRRLTPLGVLASVLGLALPALGALIPVPTAGQADAAGRSSLVVAVVQGSVPPAGPEFRRSTAGGSGQPCRGHPATREPGQGWSAPATRHRHLAGELQRHRPLHLAGWLRRAQ